MYTTKKQRPGKLEKRPGKLKQQPGRLKRPGKLKGRVEKG